MVHVPERLRPSGDGALTTTGKTDRWRLREFGFLTYWGHQLDRKHERLVPSTKEEITLLEVWMEVLNVPTEAISTDTPFTCLGGDTITGMQVVSRCRARNIAISVGDLLQERTIKRTARRSTPIIHVPPVAAEEVEGDAWQLSPTRQMVFEMYPQGHNHLNQSFLLKLVQMMLGSTLEKILRSVVTRHSMLRARFRQNKNGEWELFVAKSDPQAFAFSEHT